MNLKLYAVIAILTAATYAGIMLTTTTAEAIPTFRIDPVLMSKASIEYVMERYHNATSDAQRLVELDKLRDLTQGAKTLGDRPGFETELLPVIIAAEALIAEADSMPPQTFTVTDSQGNIVLELVGDTFTIRMDRWDVSFDGPHGTFVLKP